MITEDFGSTSSYTAIALFIGISLACLLHIFKQQKHPIITMKTNVVRRNVDNEDAADIIGTSLLMTNPQVMPWLPAAFQVIINKSQYQMLRNLTAKMYKLP